MCNSSTGAGFHFYRSQLDSGVAGDPAQAHARRGAHWTFDAEAFVQCVQRLREAPAGAPAAVTASSCEDAGVAVPSFEHGVGDPVPDAVIVMPHHKIVLIEGNYLLLGDYFDICHPPPMCVSSEAALVALGGPVGSKSIANVIELFWIYSKLINVSRSWRLYLKRVLKIREG